MPTPPKVKFEIKTIDEYRKYLKGLAKDDESKGLNERFKLLTRNCKSLEKLIKYMNQNTQKMQSLFRKNKINYRQEYKSLFDLLTLFKKKLKAVEDLKIIEQNSISRLIIKSDDGEYAGNGKCYIQFVNVGMGDCTLVTTPSGKTILIDLGSEATSDIDPAGSLVGSAEEIIRSSITSKLFLNHTDTIDLLLLTHPDSDHCNKLKAVLNPAVKKINMVYYAGTEDFGAFKAGFASDFVRGLSTDATIRKVILREEKAHLSGKIIVTKSIDGRTPPETPAYNKLGKEYIDPSTGEIVIYCEKQKNVIVFKLSVLAANTTGVWKSGAFETDDARVKSAGEMKLGGTEQNVRSLMILIESYGQKIVVTGDATAVTEQFVINYFADLLKDVNTLRIGHHGSPTSSLRSFINAFKNLKFTVVSTGGKNTRVHHLPKKRIIEEYTGLNLDAATSHLIYAYDNDVSTSPVTVQTNKRLFATGSGGTISYSIEKTKLKVFLQNRLVEEHLNISKAELDQIIDNQTESINLAGETTGQDISIE